MIAVNLHHYPGNSSIGFFFGQTRKGGEVHNNASDKTEAMIQWCTLEWRCPCWSLNIILDENHPVRAS